MNEILDEIHASPRSKRSSHRSISGPLLQVLLFGLLVLLFGIYIGNLLFGINSLEVLYGLESKKESLEQQVDRLQQNNAKLQKEYLELKFLEPK